MESERELHRLIQEGRRACCDPGTMPKEDTGTFPTDDKNGDWDEKEFPTLNIPDVETWGLLATQDDAKLVVEGIEVLLADLQLLIM